MASKRAFLCKLYKARLENSRFFVQFTTCKIVKKAYNYKCQGEQNKKQSPDESTKKDVQTMKKLPSKMGNAELLEEYAKAKIALEALDVELTARLNGAFTKENPMTSADHKAYSSWVEPSKVLDGAAVKAKYPEVWAACQKDKAGYWRKTVK